MSVFLLWDGYQLKATLASVIMKNDISDLFQLCCCQVRMISCLMTHIQWLIVQAWCFSRLFCLLMHQSSLLSPCCLAKLPFRLVSHSAASEALPLCWLSVAHSSVMPPGGHSQPQPHAHAHPRAVISRLGEAGRAVHSMWPPYVEGWSLGGWWRRTHPSYHDDGHPPTHTPQAFPTASAEKLDPGR